MRRRPILAIKKCAWRCESESKGEKEIGRDTCGISGDFCDRFVHIQLFSFADHRQNEPKRQSEPFDIQPGHQRGAEQ